MFFVGLLLTGLFAIGVQAVGAFYFPSSWNAGPPNVVFQPARVWDWRSGKVLWTLTHHTGPVDSVAFSADGKLLVSAGLDAQPIVWDVQTGKMVGERLKGHTGGTNSASFSRDGKYIVTTSNDRTARVWEVSVLYKRAQRPSNE